MATLERAVALGETSPLTLSALADAQLAAGALAPAAAGFERLLEIRGSPEDAYGLASARARQGQTDQALAALERAMQLGLAPRQVEAARNDQDLSSLRGDARFEQNPLADQGRDPVEPLIARPTTRREHPRRRGSTLSPAAPAAW